MHKKIERECTKCMFNCTKSILLIVEEFPLADESLRKLKRNVIGIDCRRLKDGTWKACYWRHPLSFKDFSVFHASLLFWQVYEGIHSRRATECQTQLIYCKVRYLGELFFWNIKYVVHPWYMIGLLLLSRLIVCLVLLSEG